MFSPTEAQSTIQADITNLYNAQAGNQFGTARYALLFEPGTYGSAASPLLVNVGYYEEVAGLGQSPTATTIIGVVNFTTSARAQPATPRTTSGARCTT